MQKDNFKHNHKNRRRAGELGTKTCFVTKETCPRETMLRFVSAPGRIIVFDVAEKLPGHGFWLKSDKSLLEQAVTKRIFYKAAHGTVKIPDDLVQQVENALHEHCLNLLALCRKAGLLVFGFEAVRKALSQGRAVVAFEAADSSARGQDKLFRPDDSFPIYTVLTRSDLGQIAGLDEIVHVALLAGKLSDAASVAAGKLTLFKGLSETERTIS